MIPATNGSHFGRSMTAGWIYNIAGIPNSWGYTANSTLATSSLLWGPAGLALDSSDNVYVADDYNHLVRMIVATNGTYFGQSMTTAHIYNIAGIPGSAGFSGDSHSALAAQIYYPRMVSVDSAGNLYISDTSNNRVRMVAASTSTNFGQSMTANDIYTIAGGGSSGVSAGSWVPGTSASLGNTYSVALDIWNNVYLADWNNYRVDKLIAIPR